MHTFHRTKDKITHITCDNRVNGGKCWILFWKWLYGYLRCQCTMNIVHSLIGIEHVNSLSKISIAIANWTNVSSPVILANITYVQLIN